MPRCLTPRPTFRPARGVAVVLLAIVPVACSDDDATGIDSVAGSADDPTSTVEVSAESYVIQGVTLTAAQHQNLQDLQSWKDTYLVGNQAVFEQINRSDMSDAATIEPLISKPAYADAMNAASTIMGPADSAFGAMVSACNT